MLSTTNLINELKSLENLTDNNLSNNPIDPITPITPIDPTINEESSADSQYTSDDYRIVCKLLHVQLRPFYENINIPLKYFRKAKWNISYVLLNNEDSLFFNKKYITDTDEKRFYSVYYKYVDVVKQILDPESILHIYLNKWTYIVKNKWYSYERSSYLKRLLTSDKYYMISPHYVATYFDTLTANNSGSDNYVKEIKQLMEQHLDELLLNIMTEIDAFKNIYNDIIESFVYEHPHEQDNIKIYFRAFINNVIIEIMSFTEKLLDLNVYAVHPIVSSIINYYTPLDYLYMYRKSSNDGRKLLFV